MTVRQLPAFAFRSATDYANEMDKLRAQYEPVLGAGAVDALERLGMFHVFTSVWFSAGLVVLILSIVACTIDRTPRLWRAGADIRVVQPEPFFDPRLPDRAAMDGVDAAAVARVLRRHRFGVRQAAVGDTAYIYGDRNRWAKMATLVTHAGLVLFLIAAAATSSLGDEQPLVLANGDAATVQPIGTPGLLLVRNLGFEAPGLETGRPSDFTTHVAVYRDGQQIADKVIRVNDPLEIAGYTLHQNGFGPAPVVVVRDAAGRPLWTGPVPMTDAVDGLPYAQLAVPGRDVGLQLILQRDASGTGILLVLPSRATVAADGTVASSPLGPLALAQGEAAVPGGADFSVGFAAVSQYTLLIAKRDPGAPIAWLAFGLLMGGLLVTFWMPRRRVWCRLAADGRLALAFKADRYVNVGREFGQVLGDLVAARGPAPAGRAALAPPGEEAPSPR